MKKYKDYVIITTGKEKKGPKKHKSGKRPPASNLKAKRFNIYVPEVPCVLLVPFFSFSPFLLIAKEVDGDTDITDKIDHRIMDAPQVPEFIE
ncbi:MAG TPA: hypothetical protein VN367_04280 [Chlorobaculum sp.]|nr:hypothetical protein [Chlorobaculum sp.]